MKRKLSKKHHGALSPRGKRLRQQCLVGILSCAVLFCTLSALRLPAVTTENTEYQLENGALIAISEESPAPEEASPSEEAALEHPAPAESILEEASSEAPALPAPPEEADAESPAPAEPSIPADTSEEAPAEEPLPEEPSLEIQTGEGLSAVPDAVPLPDGETVLEQSALQAPAALQGGTEYSSDLADFVTEVVIRDGDGNVIPPDGTVYIGESYDITISFSENNVSGQEKQFRYNEEGFLTYQIPAAFHCSPVNDGTLTDANGDIVGHYWIDESGLLKIRFIEGFIDPSKASMDIHLNATATGSEGTGHQSVDFGGYIVEVNVSSAGRLHVEKTAGNYDPRTHSIEYEVKVQARQGEVHDIVYTDTPTSPGLILDPSSIVYTSLDGQQVYSSPPDALAAGEGFLVRYRAYLDPSIYAGKNNVKYTAKNSVTVTGANDEGPISAQDTAEKVIDTAFLQKKGKDEPGNSRIRWTVTIGDGSTLVDGLTITDLPGEGLDFDLNAGITIVPMTYNQAGEPVEGTAFTIPFGTDPHQITLPEGMNAYRCLVTYYTNYSLEEGVTSQVFENKVIAGDPAHNPTQVTGTATAHAAGVTPQLEKTVEKPPEGTALHYSIEINVPGSYGGTRGFYFMDQQERLDYAGVSYFFGQNAENITVFTVNAAGERKDYAPYSGGSADYTFFPYLSRDPRIFYIGFNTTSGSTYNSRWIETEDMTLHIEYDLPLDSPIYIQREGGNYALVEDKTLQDVLEGGKTISNIGWLYYNEGVFQVNDRAYYQEPIGDPIRKVGKIREDGIIEYEVIFKNRDADFNTVLQKKMKEFIFRDMLLTEGMSYVDGSLYCDCYNASLSRIRTVYHYEPAMSGSAALNANASDFHWYAGDSQTYTTLHEYMQHSVITEVAQLVFRYQVQVDRNSPVFETPELTVPLNNQARLTGIFPDDAPFDSGPADCTVLCDTDIVKKEVAHAAGSNRADFTITLNPAGIDLLENAETMTVLDKMTANLQPVLSTIRVFQLANGEWTEIESLYTYDQENNILTFSLPDNVPLQIAYTTLITESGEDVSIGNSVELEGFIEYSSVIDTHFTVNDTGGAAHSDNYHVTLLKQASDTHQPLAGAVFALYGPEHGERQSTPPAGTPETVTVGGQTLWYYASYTTGANGTVELENNEDGLPLFSVQGLYALLEISAPEGYRLMEEPACFYADERPENGLPEIDVLLSSAPVAVPNEPMIFQLPNTGGPGTRTLRLAGAALLGGGLLRLAFRKKSAGKPAPS